MGTPGLLRPLGASAFLASGADSIFDPLPLGGAGALAPPQPPCSPSHGLRRIETVTLSAAYKCAGHAHLEWIFNYLHDIHMVTWNPFAVTCLFKHPLCRPHLSCPLTMTLGSSAVCSESRFPCSTLRTLPFSEEINKCVLIWPVSG